MALGLVAAVVILVGGLIRRVGWGERDDLRSRFNRIEQGTSVADVFRAIPSRWYITPLPEDAAESMGRINDTFMMTW